MSRRVLIADIIRHAAHLSGFTQDEIRGPGRVRALVRVRQAVCLIARQQKRRDGDLVLFAYSYPQIGAALGGRDHSTIIHACDQARNIAKRDPEVATFIRKLREASKAGEPILAPQIAVPAKPVWTMPVGLRPRLKPVTAPRQWEEIDIGSEHFMRLDQDGMTLNDHLDRDRMASGSRNLALAIQQARAA